MELRQLVSKSDSKLDVIVAVLERDPALVARVLALGRSAQFARNHGQASPDLHFIINRVGFRQLGDLVETVWANDCFTISDERYRPLVARLTRYAVARAVTMRALAETRGVEVFPAYLSGLFADVGATYLLWALVERARGRVPEPAEALRVVREHHETVSGAVLKRWGHDELVVNLVRRHHVPVLTGPAATYAHLLVLASHISNELTGEDDLTRDGPSPDPALVERCTIAVPLSEGARATLMMRLREEYAEAVGAFTKGLAESRDADVGDRVTT
jgi:HD-like signal output (HDOD) protein